jgi:predicted DsbA family dithiol-disulfide isomerase
MSTRLEIISDPICPWCYLGAANLMRALADREAHPFAISWRPYQLDPDIPAEGVDRAPYLAAKLGGAERVAASHARIAAMGREAGITYAFDRMTRVPNTLDAHRLIRWAGPEGVQSRVAMALFRRNFEEGEDISDPAVLTSVATETGMDGEVVARLLAGDADRAEVRAEAEAAREMGVTGVPTFLIGRRYVVSGAQPADLWSRVVADLEAAGA